MAKPTKLVPVQDISKVSAKTSPVEANGTEFPLVVRGVTVAESGASSVLVTRPQAALESALTTPLAFLASGKHALLEEHLLKNGYLDVAKTYAPREISSFLSQAALACKAIALEREGLHNVPISGKVHRIFVKGGECHWLTPKPEGTEVILVGTAANNCKPSKSLKQFNDRLATLLAGNPRMLVVMCFALAAMLARMFDVPQLNLGIIGMSSRGKSIVQRFVSCIVNGRDEVLAMDATVAGLNKYLAERCDQAVFIDDAHGARAADALIQAIMNTGNGGGRLRGHAASTNAVHETVTCSLIFSAERNVLETARAGRVEVNSGVYARTFELHLGKHGIFDDLDTFTDAATLAKFIASESPHYLGVIGCPLVQQVTASWPKTQSMWIKREVQIRTQILKYAEADDVTGLSGRLLDRLTFIAFAGCLLVQFHILEIKRADIYRSIGLVLKEHLNRLQASSSPVAEAVVDAVQHYIQTNQGRFQPIAQAGDPTRPNGLAGYVKRRSQGDQLYLFFPGIFRLKFVEQFGAEAYEHLKLAGYLVQQASRGNLFSVRIKLGGEGNANRQDFVAISSTILHSQNMG